jgi:hypothetical protein
MSLMPELVILVITALWIGIAMLVGRDAARRGLAPVPWALLTFFVPVLGVGIYLAVRGVTVAGPDWLNSSETKTATERPPFSVFT